MNVPSPCSSCFRHSTRREWIKRLAMSYSAYAGLSGGWSPPPARAALDFAQSLRLNLAAFPSLASDGGSAIVSFDGGETQILINRESETLYHALDPHCTHAGCIVDPYNTESSRIVCACHGSEYTIKGQVTYGPAIEDLLSYPTQLEGTSTLFIEVSELVHRIDDLSVESSTPSGARIRLTFPTMVRCQYHIRYSPDLTTPFQVKSYATAAAGIANKTILNGTGEPAIVYVDTAGTRGFFTLELLVSQLAP
jgi:nitrite reductase/ring-hydroxylating ferredoxin subunit